MINRRGFLATLAAGFALDPERLLWKPGAKLISIPAPPAAEIRLRFIKTFSITEWRPIARLDVIEGGKYRAVDCIGYDGRALDDRTFGHMVDALIRDRPAFAREIRTFVKAIPKDFGSEGVMEMRFLRQ